MTLAEIEPVAAELLPLGILRDHLRLPDGFPDDGSFDERLEQSLRAGLETVERRTGKALFARQFRWQVPDWSGKERVTIPVGPVIGLFAAQVIAADGVSTALDLDALTTVADVHGPALLPNGTQFPAIPRGHSVEIVFSAGYATGWAGLPADLREAVLILAADFFEDRASAVPPGPVEALLQRYRGLSLGRIGG